PDLGNDRAAGEWFLRSRYVSARLLCVQNDASHICQIRWLTISRKRSRRNVDVHRRGCLSNGRRHARPTGEMRMTNKATMPEPVAYAIFAENGNIRLWSTEPRDLPDLDSLGPMRQLITTNQAEAYADARVREALEEAA